MARRFNVISPPLRVWKYAVDKDKAGEAHNWQSPSFNDAEWKSTDIGIENWYHLGLADYYGAVWYRAAVSIAAGEAGKKTFLWIPSEDGDVKLFVNGRAVPYVNANGETGDQFKSGFCTPISFDITNYVAPGQSNEFALIGTRTSINEIGTGGLMAPLYLYREK
jgi:hypothetical protein